MAAAITAAQQQAIARKVGFADHGSAVTAIVSVERWCPRAQSGWCRLGVDAAWQHTLQGVAKPAPHAARLCIPPRRWIIEVARHWSLRPGRRRPWHPLAKQIHRMKKTVHSVRIVALLATVGLVALLAFRWKADDFGDPLLNAAYSGNVKKVGQLLETGEDPNKSDSYGNTPLSLAAHADQAEIARILIAHGANLSIKDNTSMTPLHCATYKGNTAVATVLLDCGASVNVTDQLGFTPLLFAVVKGPPALVKLLIDHGADINQRDEYGWQPIHRALRFNTEEPLAIVTILLEHGADPNASGGQSEPDSHVGYRPPGNPNQGDTPLAIAESNGFCRIVEQLKRHGAKENKAIPDAVPPR
jgi:ankyrin repeat protein